MTGYEYFRSGKNLYFPKTPSTAIKAFEAGIIPLDIYVYKGTSVKPLDEEPYDLEELERILSRTNLDLKTNLLLIHIFEKLIKHPDVEIALFAAEGINTIENRYNLTIEILKSRLKKQETPQLLYDLAGQYYELSVLHEESRSIRVFYLHEAYEYLKRYSALQKMEKEIIWLLLNILIGLQLFDRALGIIEKSRIIDPAYFLLRELEIYFHKREFERIFPLLARFKDYETDLDDAHRDIIKYWTGNQDGK